MRTLIRSTIALSLLAGAATAASAQTYGTGAQGTYCPGHCSDTGK